MNLKTFKERIANIVIITDSNNNCQKIILLFIEDITGNIPTRK
jgi:hypothetical protein